MSKTRAAVTDNDKIVVIQKEPIPSAPTPPERPLPETFPESGDGPQHDGLLRQEAEDAKQHERDLQSSVYMKYPKEVHIETQTVCNAACSFCPYPSLDRIGNKMSDSLINKIIKDLEDIPKEVRFWINPFKVNDPLLDVRLFDILRECNNRLSNAQLRIFTNGSALTKKHLLSIAGVKNIEHLWISLNHYDSREYEALMQLPFKRTIENLDVAHQLKANGDITYDIVVSRVADGTDADQIFYSSVTHRYPLFKCFIIKQDGWLGSNKNQIVNPNIPKTKCERWYELSITSTGIVSLCCMDGHAAYPIGDVSSRHVIEVYNDPAYRKMRQGNMDRLSYSPCSQCSH